MISNQLFKRECKHSKVQAVAVITGQPYPRNIRATVALKCSTCGEVLHVEHSKRIPTEKLKGKRFNRQFVGNREFRYED
jgi:hypothetical protein